MTGGQTSHVSVVIFDIHEIFRHPRRLAGPNLWNTGMVDGNEQLATACVAGIVH